MSEMTEDTRDPLYEEAVKITKSNGGIISISYLQRRLRIGYNRGYRLAEALKVGEGFTGGRA